MLALMILACLNDFRHNDMSHFFMTIYDVILVHQSDAASHSLPSEEDITAELVGL